MDHLELRLSPIWVLLLEQIWCFIFPLFHYRFQLKTMLSLVFKKVIPADNLLNEWRIEVNVREQFWNSEINTIDL